MTADPEAVAQVAVGRRNTACISAVSGFGIDDMLSQLEQQIELMMAKMKLLVPYSQVICSTSTSP
jgi:50S ribosomal subunit-associated GTPase HflX